jgi:hypothetical protein
MDNTQCTSACGNDYDCPHKQGSNMTTRQEQLELIRDACIRANPEIEKRRIDYVDEDTGDDTWVQDDTIRLADVLLAHSKTITPPTNSEEKSKIQNDVLNIIYWWNLRKDDINDQSDPCVAFVYQLLKQA